MAEILRHTVGVGAKNRGPRPKPDAQATLIDDLRAGFRWRADRPDHNCVADPTGWWADASILRRLGPALAALSVVLEPTVVLGPQSRGTLLGALVALEVGVGLVELRKNPRPSTDSDHWLIARTPPDYQDRTLELGVRRDLLPADARAVFVDDWIDTGAQAMAARAVVDASGATWCGVSVVVDALQDSRLRRDLNVRSLFRVRDL